MGGKVGVKKTSKTKVVELFGGDTIQVASPLGEV